MVREHAKRSMAITQCTVATAANRWNFAFRAREMEGVVAVAVVVGRRVGHVKGGGGGGVRGGCEICQKREAWKGNARARARACV